MAYAKNDLRKKSANARNSLSLEDRKKKSNAISELLFSMTEFQKAKRVLFYASFKSEVETEEMIEKSLKVGKKVLLPKMNSRSLELIEIKEFEKDTRKNTLGIPEPICTNTADCAPDLIIVPGIAFDLQGNRIGFGKGYYDRLLEKVPNVQALGLAFEAQVLEKIKAEKQDRKVNALVTEKRILRF